jgi:hypothetical protein
MKNINAKDSKLPPPQKKEKKKSSALSIWGIYAMNP